MATDPIPRWHSPEESPEAQLERRTAEIAKLVDDLFTDYPYNISDSDDGSQSIRQSVTHRGQKNRGKLDIFRSINAETNERATTLWFHDKYSETWENTFQLVESPDGQRTLVKGNMQDGDFVPSIPSEGYDPQSPNELMSWSEPVVRDLSEGIPDIGRSKQEIAREKKVRRGIGGAILRFFRI